MRYCNAVLVLSGLLCLVTVSCSRDPEALKRQYVANGDRLFAQRKHAEAIVEYRNAIGQDARFGEARLKLAKTYEAIGNFRNALAEAVRAADLLPNSVEAQVNAGRLLLVAGQFPEAKARAEVVIARDPKNVEGLVLLGNSLAGLKDLDGAITEIEEAIEQDPRRRLTYSNLGVLQLAKGNIKLAEAALKQAIVVDPKSLRAYLNLANLYWALGQRADAEQQMKAALAIDAKSPAVNRSLAAFYMTGRQMREAEQYLKAFATITSDVDSKLILADFYLTEKRTNEAVTLLEKISQDPRSFAVAKLRLARIDFDAGRRAQAYGTITEVLRRDSKNEQALETKARFLINEEKYADALSVLNPVIQANSSARSSLYLRGIALEGLRSSDEAIRAFQQLLQVDPAAVPAQLRLAVLYLARGEANTAIHFIGPLIKSQPSEALRLLYAKALLQAGDIGRADSELAALAMANPASAEVHTLIGHVHLARRDFARAGEAYERAFQLQPNSSEALAGLVQIDIVQKRPDAARRRVEKQLTARKQDPAVMMIAGNTYMSVGDPAAAAAAFEKAVELDPKNIEAFSKLGAVYMAQHRLDEGRKHYEDAARRFSNPIAATMAGIILELQKKPEEARQQYERALAIDSRSAVAANNLAWIQAETGSNLDMALQLAQTAKAQLPKHGQVSDTLGWIYYKKGLAQLAVAALREGATQSPSDPAIHYHLGLAYIKNGNTAEAKGALERALRLDPQFRGADDARRLLGMITS